MSAKTYHHGNLREALVATGIEMLDEDGAESLSLRKVARRVGVSHNAPYQHFADKEALLAAIAQEGFAMLEAAMAAAAPDDTPPTRPALLDLCTVYVRFALTHRAHFAVMFGPLEQLDYPDLYAASQSALGRLATFVGAMQAAGTLRGADPTGPTLTIWFLLHGIAGAFLADKIPPDYASKDDPDAVVRAHLAAALDGLAA
jgi:AcrR family transcriptional regulator